MKIITSVQTFRPALSVGSTLRVPYFPHTERAVYIAACLLFCVAPAWAQLSPPERPAGKVPYAPRPQDLTREEERNPYQPAGAPANPKVSIRWDRYYDSKQVGDLLEALADAHPQRARLHSLGRSYGGREMWLLSITNFAKGDDRGKPAFWIDGAIHANEIQATEVTLYTAWYLLEMYGRVPFITRLVDERTFYLMPMMSPDSRDAHMYRPNSTHSPRSGQRPFDNDRDGLVNEDRADDLDGDGHITQMRVRDPNGRWKPHPEYPELMIPAKPDEPGQYRLLGTEGYDNDGDGRVDEDADGYYDPNRNWGWDWQPEYIQGGANRYPFSIPEVRLVADFIADHPNIAGAQSYHNFAGLIVRGPGSRDESFEAADVHVFDAIARRGEAILPHYHYIELAKELYGVHGGELDWLYHTQGILAFTNELFTAWNYFRGEDTPRFGRPEDLHAFNKSYLFGDGIVPWHPVQHPQFGPIEVGGLKKNWGRQPPSFLLEEECHRNMSFTLYHADQMAKVGVQKIDIQRLPSGLTQVTATIANRRLTPTHSAIDVKRKITPPDLVTLDAHGAKPLAGLWADEPFFTNAKEQKRHPQQVCIPNVPGMTAVYARWLVDAPGPYTVTVRSEKGGTDRREGK